MTWTLAADTSTARGSIALFRDLDLAEEIYWDKENTHSERITLEAERLLKNNRVEFSEIDQYAVGIGPGSFTGIRVALNFIRALAFAFEKPVFAVDSLVLMAAPALDQGRDVFCMQAAFRNFVYCAAFEAAPTSQLPKVLLEPSALTVDELDRVLERRTLILGRGYDLFEPYLPPSVKDKIVRDDTLLDVPCARNFSFFLKQVDFPARLKHWSETKPLYIRASEAEEKLRQSVRK